MLKSCIKSGITLLRNGRNPYSRDILCKYVSGIQNASLRGLSSSQSLDIGGIFPPTVTPFNQNEEIAWDKLKQNMDKWNGINFAGYVVQGSNGEYAFMTPDERVESVRRMKEMAAPGKLILAGSGCESTRDTIEMGKRMTDAGADALLVVTPCYYKGRMNNDAMEKHYTKVADTSPLPVILYSVPGNTGIDLSADVIIKLSTHPNIIGLKDSGGDIVKIGHMCEKTKNTDFQILAGSASFLYAALHLGCVGGVCGLSNVLGGPTVDLYNMYKQGDPKAVDLQGRLIQPNQSVTKMFGISGVKQAMEWFGYYGGPVRAPLQPLTQAETSALKQIFVEAGFLDG